MVHERGKQFFFRLLQTPSPSGYEEGVQNFVRAWEGIPHQLAGASRPTGTDANAIQISRSGVATGLIIIPNRYMHSPVEMASLDDLANAANLIAAFVLSLKPEDDFVPG